MKRKIIAALILVTMAACAHQKEGGPADASDASNIIAVKVATVSPEPFMDSVRATGLVTAENVANLSFKMGGVIDRIYVNEGQSVTEGELLASLKITEINTQLDQADLALDKAQRDFIRASNLYKDSVGTLEQLQNAKTALDIAKQSVDAVTFNHQYAYIKAGASGFVAGKMANEGEVVAPGTPVLLINETGGNKDWVLRVGVSDAEWSSIYLGQQAMVRLDAFPGRVFSGKVYRKSQAADPGSGSFQVDIRIGAAGMDGRDGKDGGAMWVAEKSLLASGMFGKAVLVPKNAVNENTVPYEALIQINGDKAFVYTPGADGSLKRVDVVIKSFNEKNVIIGAGLSEGEQVVISNNAFLNEKSKIAISK